MDNFIAEIKTALFDLPLETVSRREGKFMILRAIREICDQHQYRYIPAYPAGIMPNKRRGKINLVCCGGRGRWNELFAIQVDSSNRKTSLDKLVVMKERGFTAIWVRWKTEVKHHVPDGVVLIAL